MELIDVVVDWSCHVVSIMTEIKVMAAAFTLSSLKIQNLLRVRAFEICYSRIG